MGAGRTRGVLLWRRAVQRGTAGNPKPPNRVGASEFKRERMRYKLNELESLRGRIAELEAPRSFDGESYPPGLTSFPGVLPGQGFFPGGDGLYRDSVSSSDAPPFPVGGVMVLGNDFGCLDNPDPRNPGFLQCLLKGTRTLRRGPSSTLWREPAFHDTVASLRTLISACAQKWTPLPHVRGQVQALVRGTPIL